MLDKIYEICSKDNILINEPMKNHTSFKIGGNADFLVMPDNQQQFIEIIKAAKSEKIPCFIMGNGSNLIVGDKGIRGIVVKTTNLTEIYAKENVITASCGVKMSKLANIAAENSLTGLEFASGIPGTVGGGIIMNAGAYDGEMSFVVKSSICCDVEGNIFTINNKEHEFAYRHSIFSNNDICVLSTEFELKVGNKQEILNKMSDFNQRRREKQPLNYPSAGSTFKRPVGYFAGKLIQDCNLKGVCVNDAQVSEKHSGFIINKGNANAKDVIDLINICKREVREKFDVDLDTEIKFVGEF